MISKSYSNLMLLFKSNNNSMHTAVGLVKLVIPEI